ncbi:phosphatidylinositide phosphatase SAC2 isoform X2 [Drosophila guanche]|uniref:Blast:Phosphatidylinositide phosphatase SAC2 n=1 Tax=Drosophila guanche TaxID=7266 RepID=A0A3B0K3W3_DROGU|nr:phosphatidylinositide phosphatase SAC2 isoform X2 [Drosophila guanche]SPP80679.1 blast:Phosphatidylinositide phosphatase SAC2 [Drosophila guanche]
MEVFQTDSHYIFVKRDKSLWWNRKTSEFAIKAGWDLSSVDDIECIGVTHGIVGVISLPNVYDPHLVVIKEATAVGVLYPPHLVYKIKSICILSAEEPDAELSNCTKHTKSNQSTPTHSSASTAAQNNNASATSAAGGTGTGSGSSKSTKLFEGMNKTWGAVKSAGNTIKNTTQQAANMATKQVKSTVGIREPKHIERRITEELHKIFDDTDSFYFSFDCDITNNLQRHEAKVEESQPQLDERFFWNMHMIQDILKMNDKTWILPIIQGFVQVEPCVIGNECFTLALVSRRSRHRAGTRYKRRGVDEKGNCANYVETEQILSFRHHQLSFTQVRGSVPIYWSQPGYKYRPPARLDRGVAETQQAFELHFTKELETYGRVCIVNLVEQSGKEKLIGDAYADHVIKYNNELMIYVTFDFHDYCRGMRFENVSALIDAVGPEAGAMGFHWRDQRGMICNQKSVFRVNCMDCLDRTNVVQTAIGKAVLESQLVKLGLSPPYTPIPEQLKSPFMVLWANNGDIISRQYAGTNALKGDYTRTGERKISGMMKDGMNSANRYYLARFKDSYRQATIDLMLGNQVSSESLSALGGQAAPDENDAAENAEHAKMLVEDCRRLLLGSAQYPVGAWGLIDADPSSGDASETEVDSILLLTDDCYIVAEYDSHLDKIVRFEKVQLQQLRIIELGMHQQSKMFQGSAPAHLCLRLNYSVDGQEGYFHMFRSANLRFFNNMAYVIKTQEELAESLSSIVEMFRIALDNDGNTDVHYITGGVLQRRKSKVPMLDVPKSGMPRNLSESQLVQISSKALSNVAGQFSKLGQTFKKPSSSAAQHQGHLAATINPQAIEAGQEAAEKAVFTLGGKQRATSTSSTDTEDHDNSLYEPEVDSDVEIALDKGNYNENAFLPSVGIVMGNQKGESPEEIRQLEQKDSMCKTAEDVLTISITSVTDHVSLPTGLLENAPHIRPITPNPQICVEAHEAFEAREAKPLSSAGARDLSLPLGLPASHSEANKLKQLTSPLSKLAKNIGMNLDPRKIGTKSGVLSPVSLSAENSPPERGPNSRDHLLELWDAEKCKTKLIAL